MLMGGKVQGVVEATVATKKHLALKTRSISRERKAQTTMMVVVRMGQYQIRESAKRNQVSLLAFYTVLRDFV